MNELKRILYPIIRRQQQWRTWNQMLYWWCALATVSGVILIRAQSGDVFPAWTALILGGALLFGTFVVLWMNTSRGRFDYQQLARDIEAEHPELHATLLTAIEQQPDPDTGEYNFLQERVINDAKAAYEQSQFCKVIPRSKLLALQAALTLLFLMTCVCLGKLHQLPHATTLAQALGQEESVTEEIARQAQLDQVEPGNTEVERGTPLAVLAHFAHQAPDHATLVIRDPQGTRRIDLTKNLDDPIFGATLPIVDQAFSYHVEYDGEQSETYQVNVFEFPTLDRADAALEYPTYTRLPSRTVEDTRRLSAVEGTQLSYRFHLNKPVQSARLVGPDDQSIDLKVHAGQPLAELPPLALTQTQSWKLELTDAAGRQNKIAPRIEVSVYANKPPVISVSSPHGDQQVSPLEEVDYAAEIEDDFGLGRYGLTYNINGGEMQEIPLGQPAPGNTKAFARHLLALETLEVEPDQLINWFFWAEDTGPDGQPRSAYSDMFFAEIRPFEQIFRQGDPSQQQQQQQQQQQSPNQQTEELIKLQKQIINATWKLRRQPATLFKDAPVLVEGQTEALTKARVLLDKSSDEKATEHIKAVVAHMERAVNELTEATQEAAALMPALAAEQAAYQSLLRLQAHEFQVSQQQQQQSSQQQQQQSNQRAQSQLDQLDLRKQEDRYETERQARKLEEPKQREQLQVLSRLRDLAQRQQDLNEKLKELESALRAAETAKAKEEIERQLKRLREEQRQNLADLDELNQRMEKPENRAEMQPQRQQLEQTRQQMNEAAEQMQKGQLSQAISNSTRAQKDLQEMRDDLREKTSNQFAEEMRTMRRDARELSEKQKELSNKLDQAEKKNEPHKSLTGTDNQKEITKELNDQQKKLENLLEDMKNVVEKSEIAEPLLNRKLYETFREAHQDQADKSLKAAATLLEQKEDALRNNQLLRTLDEIMDKDPDKQKLIDQLRQRDFRQASKTLSEQGQRKLNDLKKGVEQAAESVLGNETEALKFAEQQLSELSEALKNEKAEATGKKPNEQAASKTQQGKPGQQKGDPNGEEPNAQNKPAQAQGDSKANQPNSPNEQAGQPNQKPNPQGQPNQPNQPTPPNSQAQQAGQQPQTGPASFLEKGFNRSERGQNPITGGHHREWTDRLRDVEEAVDRPEVREQVAQIREDIRKLNTEFRRNSKEPEWDLVEKKILKPLDEVRRTLAEELAKSESDRALVPIDRDPVPSRFSDLVEKYYERLGEGK